MARKKQTKAYKKQRLILAKQLVQDKFGQGAFGVIKKKYAAYSGKSGIQYKVYKYLFEQGFSYREIAKLTGKTHEAIRHAVKNAWAVAPSRKQKRAQVPRLQDVEKTNSPDVSAISKTKARGEKSHLTRVAKSISNIDDTLYGSIFPTLNKAREYIAVDEEEEETEESGHEPSVMGHSGKKIFSWAGTAGELRDKISKDKETPDKTAIEKKKEEFTIPISMLSGNDPDKDGEGTAQSSKLKAEGNPNLEPRASSLQRDIVATHPDIIESKGLIVMEQKSGWKLPAALVAVALLLLLGFLYQMIYGMPQGVQQFAGDSIDKLADLTGFGQKEVVKEVVTPEVNYDEKIAQLRKELAESDQAQRQALQEQLNQAEQDKLKGQTEQEKTAYVIVELPETEAEKVIEKEAATIIEEGGTTTENIQNVQNITTITTEAGDQIVLAAGNGISVSGSQISVSGDYSGQGSINTVGTISSGTWQGSQVQDSYVADNITASKYIPLDADFGGDVSGNYDSIVVDDNSHEHSAGTLPDHDDLNGAGTMDTLAEIQTIAVGGDVSGTVGTITVTDDSHTHTGSTISGIDISDDTNLVGGDHLTLTGDTLGVDDDFVLNTGDTINGALTVTDDIYTEDNLYVGSNSETITDAGFVMDGDDAFVAGTFAVEGDIYTDGTIHGNVAGSINPGFTAGSVIFQGPAGMEEDNANFFWDDTNNRLGIGTASPSAPLDIAASGDGTELLRLSTERPWTFRQIGTGGAAYLDLHSTTSGKYFQISSPNGNRSIYTGVSDTAGSNLVYLVPDGGLVGIGLATVPNEKLEVSGNTRISGAYKIDSTQVLSLGNGKLTGNLIVGDGGTLLTHAAGSEGYHNTALGLGSLNSVSTGYYNTALGYQAGYSINTSNSNFYGGYQTGYYNVGGGNVVVGYQSGYGAVGSNYNSNTFIGRGAGYSSTSGSSGLFGGYGAGYFNTSGAQNVFLGLQAGFYNQTGSYNALVGYRAGFGVSGNSYSYNTFIGQEAGYSTTTGGNNVFLGYQAGYNETGSNKLYVDSSNTATPLLYGDFSTDALTVNGTLGTTGNITVTKADPAIVLNTTTATDTDFWVGVTEDAGGDDDDRFQIGDGTTPGTNPFVTIDTSGNVGIGTAGPGIRLEVLDSATGAKEVGRFGNTNQAGAADAVYIGHMLYTSTGSNKQAGYIQVGKEQLWDNADNNTIDSYMSFNLRTDNAVGEKMRISSGGYVGIGDTSPVANLVVGSDAGAGYANGAGDVYIQNDLEVDGTIYGNISGTINPGFTNGSVIFQGASGLAQDNTNFFWDDSTDRLGILDNTPSYTLDVGGDINIADSAEYRIGTTQVLSKGAGSLTGNLIVGDGGTLLTHAAGSEGYYNTTLGFSAGSSLTTGYQNVAIGNNALSFNQTGLDNTAVGYQAGYSNTASYNLFFGRMAGYANTSGTMNSYLGGAAGRYNQTGSYNTLVGKDAGVGAAANSYSNNTFIGYQTGYSTTTGGNNFFGGYQAGYSNTTGGANVLLGRDAGFYNQTGNYNTLIGNTAGTGSSSNSFSNNTFIGYGAGYSTTTGGNNVALGYQAGYLNQTGTENVFLGGEAGYANTASSGVLIGYYAAYANTSGVNNVAIGNRALRRNETGGYNTAVGTNAGFGVASNSFLYNALFGFNSGYSLTTGSYNTFLGGNSGYSNTEGQYNLFAGEYSAYANTTGSNNVALGDRAMRYSQTGGNNVVIGYYAGLGVAANSYSGDTIIGYQAGYSNTTGTQDVFLGYQAGYSNTASYNTLLGYQAGYSNSTGERSVNIGNVAGYANTTGSSNVFIGDQSGRYTQSGNYNVILGQRAGYGVLNNSYSNNTFIGYQTGYSTTTGGSNFFGGYQAGYLNQTGANNVFVGNAAGYNNTASDNIFIGYSAGLNNTSGGNNTILGRSAGYYNQTGNANTLVGYQAGQGVTGNSYAANTFIGYQTGLSTTTGGSNFFGGYQAGYANTAGVNSVYLGYQAGRDNAEAGNANNTFVGHQAGFDGATGNNNVFVGTSAGDVNTGNYNTFIGVHSGGGNTSGNSNTYLGYGTGITNSTGTGNVFIGYSAGWNETGSDKLYVDNSNTATPLIYGDFGTDALTVNGIQEIDTGTGTGTAMTIDQDDLDQTALDFDLNNLSGDILNMDWEAPTTLTGVLQAIDIDFTNVTADGTNAAYGIHLNDFNALTASAEYAIYVQGTNWDYSIVTEGDILLNNSGAELVIRDSDSTHYGTIDIGNLTADATYTFSGVSGTVVTTTNEAVFTGAGRHARKIQLNAEYSGAALTKFYGSGTDVDTTGTIISDAEPAADLLRTYYNWTSSEVALNYYTVAVRVTLPQDFDSWATDNAVQVDFDTNTILAADNVLDIYIYNGDDTPASSVASDTGNVCAVADTWETAAIDDSSIDDGVAPDWDGAGETAVIYLRLGAKDSNFIRIGDIKLNYLSKW